MDKRKLIPGSEWLRDGLTWPLVGLREINGSRGDFGGACPRRWRSLEEVDGADRACVFQFQWQDAETADFCRPLETSIQNRMTETRQRNYFKSEDHATRKILLTLKCTLHTMLFYIKALLVSLSYASFNCSRVSTVPGSGLERYILPCHLHYSLLTPAP